MRLSGVVGRDVALPAGHRTLIVVLSAAGTGPSKDDVANWLATGFGSPSDAHRVIAIPLVVEENAN